MPARKNKSKPKGKRNKDEGPNAVHTYPSLHGRVLEAINGSIDPIPWFSAPGEGAVDEEYSTNIMGRFQCGNESCKVVAIHITKYTNSGYTAEVFGQRCRSCNKLGILTLDEQSYVDRVSYRLQKWAGVHVMAPVYNGRDDRPPHKTELCEGCKRGRCPRAASFS
ncbi:zinc-binding domain-containing protein [Cercophora newfieldiana]|uniref:Zinc-binding domain-containing protein n=1 Tax=Cercophora newfieldiana TaxID=92897 RepID=A0AA40CZZ8_9PEZI|nr:zinc-binding domain-containing protein [Cercophora newfieldiana]